MSPDAKAGEGGSLGEVRPFDVLRPLMAEEASGLVRFEGPLGVGFLWMRGGEVVDAELDGIGGLTAAQCLISLSRGTYFVQRGSTYRERTIELPTWELIAPSSARTLEWSRLLHRGLALDDWLHVQGNAKPKSLGKQEAALLKLVEHPHKVIEVLHLSGEDPLVALRRLVDLHEAGLITTEQGPPRTQPTSSRPASSHPASSHPAETRYSIGPTQLVESVMVHSSHSSRPPAPRQSAPPPKYSSRPAKLAPPRLGRAQPSRSLDVSSSPEPRTEPRTAVHTPVTEVWPVEAPKLPAAAATTGTKSDSSDALRIRTLAIGTPIMLPPPPGLASPIKPMRSVSVGATESNDDRRVATDSSPPAAGSERPAPAPSSNGTVGIPSARPVASVRPDGLQPDHRTSQGFLEFELESRAAPFPLRYERSAALGMVPAPELSSWKYQLAIVGTLLAALAMALVAWMVPALAVPLVAVSAALSMVSLVMQLRFVFVLWGAIQDEHAPLSPAKAVVGLLIPIFNVYWALRVFVGYPRAFNAFADRHGIQAPRLSLGHALAAFCLPGVGLLIYAVLIGKWCKGVNAIRGAISQGSMRPLRPVESSEPSVEGDEPARISSIDVVQTFTHQHGFELERRVPLCERLLPMAHGGFVIAAVPAPDGLELAALVAIEMAMTLAIRYGKRVLLLDANTRGPEIHTRLSLEVPMSAGFSLQLQARLMDGVTKPWTVLRCAQNLDVLVEGTIRSPDAITTEGFGRAVRGFKHEYDCIVVNAPRLDRPTESSAIEGVADAVIFTSSRLQPLTPELTVAFSPKTFSAVVAA